MHAQVSAEHMTALRSLAVAISLSMLTVCATKVEIVVDTDIGLDMDDSWSLSYILSSPDIFDVKLIVTASGNTTMRAQIVAKLMSLSGRDDVPIGIGMYTEIPYMQSYQYPWAADFPLNNYSGHVEHDGVASMAHALTHCREPTIIALGPFTNLAALARRFPDVARRTRVFAMGGSIKYGYPWTKPGAVAEYNVRTDVNASQFVLRDARFRSWYITPLDTCGALQLTDMRYRKLLEAAEDNTRVLPILRALLNSYRSWFDQCSHDTHIPGCSLGLRPYCPANASSVLWDVLPSFSLAWQGGLMAPLGLHKIVRVVNMKLCVTDKGLTVSPQPEASSCGHADVALTWQEGGIDVVLDNLVSRLTSIFSIPIRSKSLEETIGAISV